MHRDSKRILVVDDDADSAEVIADTLVNLGHDVEIAHDGPSALAAAQRFSPDIVFLDIGMPVMDGYEVAARLRAGQTCREHWLVAVTGYGQDGEKARSREAGFDLHLVKPIDFEALAHIVGDLSTRSRRAAP